MVRCSWIFPTLVARFAKVACFLSNFNKHTIWTLRTFLKILNIDYRIIFYDNNVLFHLLRGTVWRNFSMNQIDLILKLKFEVILWMNAQMSTSRTTLHNCKSYKSTSKQSSWSDTSDRVATLFFHVWYLYLFRTL